MKQDIKTKKENSPNLNPLRKLAGQTAIYGMSSIIGRLLNYLLVPLYTRVFMPSEFGIISELYAYIAFFNVLLTYGMETSFFRHYQSDENKKGIYSTSFISLLITSSIFFIFVYIFSDGIASLIRYSDNIEYINWLALIVVLDAISSIPFAKLRADNKPKKFALIKLLNIGFNIFFNLFFIVLCPYVLKNWQAGGALLSFINFVYSPHIGVGYVFIANLIASICTFCLLMPLIFQIEFKFNKVLWRRMIIYALPLLIAGMAGIVNETIDRILIKFLLPKEISMEQLGIYGACYKISIIITIFIQAFRFAADPFFFAHAQNKDAKDIYASVMNYFIITCLIIFLAIMLYIDVVKHFVGIDYHSGLKIVPILLLANIFLGIFYNLSIWYKLSGKTIYGAYLSILGAITTLILNFLWIPLWGYIGAAWATLICYFVMMVASYILGQKHYHVNYNIKKVLFYFLITFGFYVIAEFIKPLISNYNLIVNTLLLFCAIFIFVFAEKKKILQL